MADDLENKSENKSEIKKLSKTKKLLKLALPTRPIVVTTSPSKADESKKIPLVLIIRQLEKHLSRILKIKKLNRLIKMLNLIKSWMTLKMKRNQSYL